MASQAQTTDDAAAQRTEQSGEQQDEQQQQHSDSDSDGESYASATLSDMQREWTESSQAALHDIMRDIATRQASGEGDLHLLDASHSSAHRRRPSTSTTGSVSANERPLQPIGVDGVLDKLTALVGRLPIVGHSQYCGNDAALSPAMHFCAMAHSLATYLAFVLPDDVRTKLSSETYHAAIAWYRSLAGFSDDVAMLLEPTVQHARASVLRNAGVRAGDAVLVTEAFERNAEIARAVTALFPAELANAVTVHVDSSAPTWNAAHLRETLDALRAAGQTPRVLFANVGMRVTGGADDIERLRAVCDDYGVWLHVEGSSLAFLASRDGRGRLPGVECVRTAADSVLLSVAEWFSVPLQDAVTAYPRRAPGAAPVAVVRPPAMHALASWMLLQFVGLDQLGVFVDDLLLRSAVLLEQLRGAPCVCVQTVAQLPQVVLARADSPSSSPEADALEGEAESDTLTRQLFLTLRSEFPQVFVDLVQTGKRRWMRFDVTTQASRLPPVDVVRAFGERLRALAARITYMRSAGLVFGEAVANSDSLVSVECDNFFGIAAVRYVPTYVQSSPVSAAASLPAAGASAPATPSSSRPSPTLGGSASRVAGVPAAPAVTGHTPAGDSSAMLLDIDRLVDQLNARLGERLQPMRGGSLFRAIAAARDGRPAIGVVTELNEPHSANRASQLATLIAEAGSEIEEELQILDKVGNALRAAQHDAIAAIERAKADRARDRGVIRNLPWIGGVWNWFSPVHTAPVMGRTFNIASETLGPSSQGAPPRGSAGDGES